MEKFVYNDAMVRAFLMVTVLWGVVAMLVGLIVALELVLPSLSLGLPYLSFGRLRPLHTNAAIFAFAGNAIFAAVYHSTQRLCKARMFSDFLSWFHFWGWQLIIVAGRGDAAAGLHAVEGIRRTGMADRPDDCRGVGGVRRQLLRHAGPPPRTPHVRGPVVLHRHGRGHHRPARLQQPGAAGRAAEELPGLCRRAGRLHAVVVRAQRGGASCSPRRSWA